MSTGSGSQADRFADPYTVLGVSRTATADEIKAAYRRLAREHHPDVSKAPDAEAAFSRIQAAYDLLSTPEARARYDRFGHVGGPAGGGRAGSQGRGSRGGPGGSGGGYDVGFDAGEFSDLFESFFGQGQGSGPGFEQGFGRGFGQGFGRGGGPGQSSGARPGPGSAPRPAGRRPVDTTLETTIDFAEAVRGTEVELRVTGPASTTGEGARVTVKIPPATHDGDRLRVPGSRAGVPGNIIITVRVRPDSVYEMRESTGPSRYDLEVEVPITIAEATLGGTVDVPTPTGQASIRIPEGTKSGTRLRLRGRAMRKPVPKGQTQDDQAPAARGDLFAILQIVPPGADALTDEDRKALEAMVARSGGVRESLAASKPIDPDPASA